MSVFGGPVFQPDDQVYRGVGLPSEYWKLIVFKEDGVLKARAFLLTQDLDQLRVALALDEFRVYQVSVGELEQRTQLDFDESIQTADDSSCLPPRFWCCTCSQSPRTRSASEEWF
ncbi:DNA/RNA non-specific endonuclease [Glutamicibacter arilaitensis]|uniref:DNA/RNA non-specific endonuclease n=1 Tax=Glutamicibacter arilaitensis TaxID=256701 RepID=UPI00384A83AF